MARGKSRGIATSHPSGDVRADAALGQRRHSKATMHLAKEFGPDMTRLHGRFHPETALPIGPGGHDDAAILRDIVETSRHLGVTPGQPAVQAAIKAISSTGRRLMDAGRYADCLRLAASAPPAVRDRAAIAMQRIHSLRALEDWASLIAEVDRLFALPKPDERLDGLLTILVLRIGISWLLAPCPRLSQRLGAPFPHAVSALLADDWPGDRAEIVAAPDHLKLYEALTTRTLTPAARQRLALGSQLATRMNALQRGAIVAQSVGSNSELTAVNRFADLQRRLHSDLIGLDLRPLHDALAAGRTIFLLRAHAGLLPRALDLQSLGLPMILIARSSLTPPGWTVFGTNDPQTRVFAFVRLAKALRQRPHLVMVYPDGPDGADFAQVPFRGHLLRIALGPAMLAAQRPSQLFFLRERVLPDRIEASFTPGPCVGPGMPRPQLEQRYLEFYQAGIAAILDGDPISVAGFTFLDSVLPARP